MDGTAQLTVTSTDFRDGSALPAQFTCDGAGRVPSLRWSGVPEQAAALAVVVDDPDAPRGTFTHWLVLDLPPDLDELAEGLLPAGAVEARNSGGTSGWYPPCPPSGTHRYRFTVYALGRATGLARGAALDEALVAVRTTTLAQGRITGTYARAR